MIEYDPMLITYVEILKYWMGKVSPYYNGKRQYRSAVFYNSPEQERLARDAVGVFSERAKGSDQKVYIDIEPVSAFYKAEEYHQNFMAKRMGVKY